MDRFRQTFSVSTFFVFLFILHTVSGFLFCSVYPNPSGGCRNTRPRSISQLRRGIPTNIPLFLEAFSTQHSAPPLPDYYFCFPNVGMYDAGLNVQYWTADGTRPHVSLLICHSSFKRTYKDYTWKTSSNSHFFLYLLWILLLWNTTVKWQTVLIVFFVLLTAKTWKG